VAVLDWWIVAEEVPLLEESSTKLQVGDVSIELLLEVGENRRKSEISTCSQIGSTCWLNDLRE